MSRKTQNAAARSMLSKGKREICIFDRRFQHSRTKQEWLETSGLDWKSFGRTLCQTFSVRADEDFVLVTTERRVLDADEFLRLQNGTTLYMLRTRDQALEMPTEELINFTPHHDTVVESGTYKYYDSEGKKSLPYALADLVDNALTATANNTGERRIEIRMMFDESLGKPAVIVLDNGCGMTSKQLNNWAVYKLSKFTRDSQSDPGGYVRPVHLPRSLNSDISYFGVGGKQAAFYIGTATRMISKSITSPDVHELVLSKSLFDIKEKNKEDTYSTTILNRRPGDFAHINKSQEQFLQDLIAEECNKGSFTAVVITEVLPEHIHFLKEDFVVWTRQLAHIYHYYIHGVDGNVQIKVPEATNSDSDQISKIDILISFKTKGQDPYVINLRSISTDMQSQYIKAAVSTFEFQACTNPDAGIMEGILRYHPFLYENETYPEDPDAEPDHHSDDDDDETDYMNDIQAKKRKKPIFECFWNGRLIPYTTISEFDWCSQPSKGSKVPPECYNRVSGVLFTDDTFRVTENKLTFIDLEKKLKNKDTVFTSVVKGQRQRTNLQRDFSQWLCACHEQFDKQVKFMNYQDTITRSDIPTKRKQHPWATFSSVEWHGRLYKAGQYVKTQKTLPIYHGTVKRFLFYGNPDSEGDVFAPGGQVEICLEPKGLYESTKIVQLSKLDRNASIEEIKKSIKRDSEKLPSQLKVDFPKENQWEDNSTQLAGTVLGPIQVQILNKKGESISRITSAGQQGRKLSVKLKLVLDDTEGDLEISSAVAHHSSKWGFWFKEIEHLVELGEYTLYLSTVLTDTNAPNFGERRLPHYKLRFTITEGKAMQFDVGAVSSSLRVGVPFDIPLHMKDIYGHPVNATSDLTASLHCSDLDVSYEQVKCGGKILTIKNVRAKGKLKKHLEPNPYDLCVTLDGLKDHTKTFRIYLLPGVARFIHVTPKEDPIHVENGNTVQFRVLVQDETGNTTSHPKITAQCLVPKQPPASIPCLTGFGTHVTKPIKVSIVQGAPQRLKVNFIPPKSSGIKEVVRTLLVLPSTQAHRMELYIQDGEPLMLKNGEKIQYLAGGVLENLYFKLYDEANNKVEVTAAVASKIKVNWVGKMNEKELMEGKLPDVKVPTKVGEEYFRQVSYQDQSISFSFTIVPIPDQAEGMKATVPKCTVRLGESFPEPIILELIDQYNNITNTLDPSCVDQIIAEGEGLDKTLLNYKFQKDSCSVLVTGVCFKAGTPGSREMSFTFKGFTCSVKLKVAAGVPAQLNLVKGPMQPLQIINGQGIPTPFVIQLCDQWNNPSPDQRVVVKMWPSPEIKVNAEVLSQPVDPKGQASFKVLCVSGPKGYYRLKFEAIFKKPIQGPSVNLTVLPDPNKPVDLKVQYDTRVSFIAGNMFPVFSVTVMSDEDSPITRFNPAAVSMFCWKGGLAGKTPPPTAYEFQCNRPMENEDKRAFYFREKPIPEDAGKYTVQFCLREHRNIMPLYSKQIIVNVEANKPVKLAPDHPPPAQVVSYCQDIAKRILLENLTLKIVDQYGNPAGQGLNGEVEIRIKNQNDESTEPHPLFEGEINCHKIKLINGKAHFERLAVMKNSPGKHDATYIVLFRPLLSPAPPEPLESYEFQFSFSHDAQNQEKRQALTRFRDEIKEKIRVSTNKLNLRKNVIQAYNVLFKNNSDTIMGLRSQLTQRNLPLSPDVTVPEVNVIIRRKSQEQRQIAEIPRRICRLTNDYQNIDKDILGRVGHLALVEDDAAAWVISWHMRGDMNCVITTTQQVAMRIYERTNGTQEVLPLTNIFPQRPPGPLPHIIKNFAPVGNPVYAVDVLIYPHKEEQKREQCKIVFRNILGRTILIDDLKSANKYRQLAVANNVQCPTIITRQGERLTSHGKFGGAGNKAPPRNQLNMFGAPLPNIYYCLEDDIKLLKDYKTALEQKIQNEAEYTEECNTSLPEIQLTEKDLESFNKQLEDTERQLRTPVHPVRRASPNTGEPSGIPAKRSKF